VSTLDLDLATAQARSVLARATSAHASWLDPESTERNGSLVTAIYLDHPGRPTSGHRSPVVLEIADPAPVPVRDRVRAAVRLYGDAARSGEAVHEVRIQPVSVQLETGGTTVTLNPVDLWLAEPDPLALAEAELLGHLDVRLTFRVDVTDPGQAGDALASLVGIGERSGLADGKALRRLGLLAAVLGAGPAAARICTARSTTLPRTHSIWH
jgi:hypothetical protein